MTVSSNGSRTFPPHRLTATRSLQTAAAMSIAVLAFLALAAPTPAAAKPGWTGDKAERFLEINVSLVHQGLVAAAQKQLEQQQRIGGTHGIAEAQADLRTAKAGFEVQKATCQGARKAAGGYVSFRCKLTLTPMLGWAGSAKGSLARNAVTGRWKWQSSSFVLR